jgi:hypothetical protein
MILCGIDLALAHPLHCLTTRAIDEYNLMFVKLLSLLISNVLVSFSVLVFYRLLSYIWG